MAVHQPGVDHEAPAKKASLASMPWKHPALAAYVAAYALGAMPLGLILYNSSLYLHAKFGWDQAMLGKVLWIPPLGWEISYFVWGTLLDRYGPRHKGLMLASLIITLPLAFTDSLPSGAWVLASFFVAMFAVAGFVVLSVNWATRVFPAEHIGLISGVGPGRGRLLWPCRVPELAGFLIMGSTRRPSVSRWVVLSPDTCCGGC